jgi:4-alpha-glucanotransferase
MAPGVRIGAPPDAFNPDGQDWGLPPFVPWKLRAVGYQPFARTLRAAMRHLGALRIDHAMGLFRLYWLPDGATPAEGAFVRYREQELLDIVALESARAGVTIVGEDLGTIDDDMRDALRDRGVLSYRVAWFEDDPPTSWPEQALASMTTHDLPTVAGVWSGTDGDESIRARLDALAGGATDLAAVTVNAHRRLAASPCAIAVATLEDALGVLERPNRPGTTTEHANWSVALPLPLDDLVEEPTVLDVAAAIGSRGGAD